MNVSTCPPIDINELKMVSKVEGVTINDVMLSALSNTFNTVFKENGDPSKEIHLNMPVNIRFNFYETRDDVKIENRFSIMPLRIPLFEDM